jgi:hypothetical protein
MDCKRDRDYGKKRVLCRHDRRRQSNSVITFIKLRIRRQIGVPFEDYSFSSSPVSRPTLDGPRVVTKVGQVSHSPQARCSRGENFKIRKLPSVCSI